MFPFEFECIIPADIQPKIYDEIVKLHQKAFNIPDGVIIDLMKQRELVILYRDKDSGTLIGTAGVQWIPYKENIIIYYVGNLVIDAAYRNIGMLNHIQMYAIQMTYLKFPEKQCYAAALITTEHAYLASIKQFPDHTPRGDRPTPVSELEMMKHIAEAIVGKDHYKIQDGAIITTKLSTKVGERKITQAHSFKPQSEISFFHKVNKEYASGEQLLLCGPVNLHNMKALLNADSQKIRIFIKHHPKSLMKTIMRGVL